MGPRLALTVGDPAGIGPEITPAAVRAIGDSASVIVLGPGTLRPDWLPSVTEQEVEDGALHPSGGGGHAWVDTGGPATYEIGVVQKSCGAAAVEALRVGHRLALGGHVDALVTGPVNKAALHAAGTRVEGQTELLSRWCEADRTEMLGLAGKLRVMLATRHMPLREAISQITVEHVLDRLLLLDQTLRELGHSVPRIGLAGLNPHAGEGGLLGSEDGEILVPAAEAARVAGVNVRGPISPDTIFAEGVQGLHDGILALYHDQAFIPLKLMAGGRGVTYIAGLPYRRFSPMHGTAFDIVGETRPDGQPVADPGNLIEALRVAISVTGAGAE